MFTQKLDPAKLFTAYGVQLQMIYPWEGVVEPPFGAAWAVVPPGGSTKHHGHQEAETFFVVKGRGVMRIGDETRPVEAGDMVYQPPFHHHTLENPAGGEDLVFLTFWWEDMSLWTGHGRDPGTPGNLWIGHGRDPGSGTAAPRRVMVTAAPPTPNGDLHVGHLSGPYLAGDIHTRYLKLRGAEAHYIFGSDDNQIYVLTHAARLGLAAAEAADRLSAEIAASLGAAGFELDEFVRPHASPWYTATVQEFFRRLYDEGQLEARETLVPWCAACERYLFDAYIRGRCPHCGAPWGCNCCEQCGRHCDAAALLDAECATCGAAPERRALTRLYFPLSRWAREIRDYHTRVAMSPNLRALCEQVIAEGLPDLPVTQAADWGIPVPVAGFPGQRIFVWCEMAPRYLAYARHLGGGWERWFKAPDADLVQCFGFDNSFYYACFLPALLRAYDPQIRLASAFLMNRFYLLEGRKFSTTRGHAIMARDLLAGVPADVARLYLAATCPEFEETNFTLDDFAATVDRMLLGEWQPWLGELAARAREEFGGRVPATGDWTEEQRAFYGRLEALTAAAGAAYEARSFSPQRAARALDELVREARRFGRAEQIWRRAPARGEERRTAMALELLAAKTLALIAAPVMPELAARLWRELGYAAPLGRWEDRPSWVPAGQTLGPLAAAPYFPSVRHCLDKRKLQTGDDEP